MAGLCGLLEGSLWLPGTTWLAHSLIPSVSKYVWICHPVLYLLTRRFEDRWHFLPVLAGQFFYSIPPTDPHEHEHEHESQTSHELDNKCVYKFVEGSLRAFSHVVRVAWVDRVRAMRTSAEEKGIDHMLVPVCEIDSLCVIVCTFLLAMTASSRESFANMCLMKVGHQTYMIASVTSLVMNWRAIAQENELKTWSNLIDCSV
jgi:hypothetical protein